MEHFVKNIFDNNINENIHGKFIRYSKGDFTGLLMKIRKQKGCIKIKASFHVVDELLTLALKYAKNKEMHITGFVSYNKDLSEEFGQLGLKYVKVRKARGIFNYTLDDDLNLKDFLNTFIKYIPLVNFSDENIKITTKKAFPKPSKEISGSFCHLELPLESEKEVYKLFAFDVGTKGAKSIDIEHRFIVNEVVYPKIEGDEDFDYIRKQAKRVGIIKRKIIVDKVEKESEVKYSV